MRRALAIAVWVMQAVLVIMIGGSGVEKLYSPSWPEQFATWGYPDHFVLVIGALEVAGAIGLVIKPLMAYSGLLFAAIMIGATATHLMHDAGLGTIAFHVVLIAICCAVAFARRPAFLRPRPNE